MVVEYEALASSWTGCGCSEAMRPGVRVVALL